jgi:hypothetical protein
MRAGRLVTILPLTIPLVSCVNVAHRGDFELFSPLGVPARYEILDPHVTGRSCYRWYELVGALFAAMPDRPMVAEAVDAALAKAPGADALAMVDVRVTEGCYEVEGAAIATTPSP